MSNKTKKYAQTKEQLEQTAQAQETQNKETALAAAKRDPTIQALVTQAPRGKTKIGASPHFEDVIRLFYSGWTPYEIKDWLRNKGIQISVIQLYDYRSKHIQEDQVHKKPELFQKLKDVINNELGIMETVIANQKIRVDKLQQAEDKLPGQTIPELSKEKKMLFQMSSELLHLKQDLGLLPKRPTQIQVDSEHRQWDMDTLIPQMSEFKEWQAKQKQKQDEQNEQEADYQDIEQPAAEP